MSKKIKTAETRVTIKRIQELYHLDEKISMVTAYDYTTARIVDESPVDMVLVGDSLGMVIQGHKNTLPVDIEHMVYHTKCVAAGVQRAHIMSDLPFLSYQISHEDAVKNAGALLKAGAQSVKIEGGEEMSDLVWYLNRIGIPVMGHVGLKPQSIHRMGGYKIQGKSKADAEEIINDAKSLEDAGAFALLLEGIPLEVAKELTESVNIPTIGIGSGPYCSGQVLVINDILGADESFKPRFVRQYMNFFAEAKSALQNYVTDVKSSAFPSEQESVHRNLVEVKAFEKPGKKKNREE